MKTDLERIKEIFEGHNKIFTSHSSQLEKLYNAIIELERFMQGEADRLNKSIEMIGTLTKASTQLATNYYESLSVLNALIDDYSSKIAEITHESPESIKTKLKGNFKFGN